MASGFLIAFFVDPLIRAQACNFRMGRHPQRFHLSGQVFRFSKELFAQLEFFQKLISLNQTCRKHLFFAWCPGGTSLPSRKTQGVRRHTQRNSGKMVFIFRKVTSPWHQTQSSRGGTPLCPPTQVFYCQSIYQTLQRKSYMQTYSYARLLLFNQNAKRDTLSFWPTLCLLKFINRLGQHRITTHCTLSLSLSL